MAGESADLPADQRRAEAARGAVLTQEPTATHSPLQAKNDYRVLLPRLVPRENEAGNTLNSISSRPQRSPRNAKARSRDVVQKVMRESRVPRPLLPKPAVVGVEEEPDGVPKVVLTEGSRQKEENQATSPVRSRLMRNRCQVKTRCGNQALRTVRESRVSKPLLPVSAVTRRKEQSDDGLEFVRWEGPKEMCSSSFLKAKRSNQRGAVNDVQFGYRHPWPHPSTSSQLQVVGREEEKSSKEFGFVSWEGPEEREAVLLDREGEGSNLQTKTGLTEESGQKRLGNPTGISTLSHGRFLSGANHGREIVWSITQESGARRHAIERNPSLSMQADPEPSGRKGKRKRPAELCDGIGICQREGFTPAPIATELGEAATLGCSIAPGRSCELPDTYSGLSPAAPLVPATKNRRAESHSLKRKSRSQQSKRASKRPRIEGRRNRSEYDHRTDLKDALQWLEDQYEIKSQLSSTKAWCHPIPLPRKIETVQNFYNAMHDRKTLPIYTCLICYGKYAEEDLEYVSWVHWRSLVARRHKWPASACLSCFPDGADIPSCKGCAKQVRKRVFPPAAILHGRLKCEHAYPEELKGLTPVEEKLIALNSCYGFFTKHTVVAGCSNSADYAKHVKGHITVFPNNVKDLVTNVLPHPLLRVMEDIHVSWHGTERPHAKDLAGLLSVRRRKVEAALFWLRHNNPHYKDIEIDGAEMETWERESHGVPSQILDRLERNEPTALDKIRTAQVVPQAEQCVDENEVLSIDEILASLSREENQSTGSQSPGVRPRRRDEVEEDVEQDECVCDSVQEINASGMFALDGRPEVTDAEKLRFMCHAMGSNASEREESVGAGHATASARVQLPRHGEPFIQVSRGDDFADAFEPSFFPKAFPTLFPWGVGGPRLADEQAPGTGAKLGAVCAADAAEHGVASLLASRNMSLRTWADVVLRRHGGRLDAARKELEENERTSDDGIRELLKSISLYGFRQPMSREMRLSSRRKIKSFILFYGMPAIWFTLNPNDLTNPIKLRLAAYRTHDPEDAEAFLTSLDMAFKRARLAVSDPDSVFGRISQYFGAVETNERGALHIHGLLWLHGNAQLGTLLKDLCGDGQHIENKSRDTPIRSVTSNVAALLSDTDRFAAEFDEEANFCAGATQQEDGGALSVWGSLAGGGEDGVYGRRGAADQADTPDGHRWNKAMAVGLRHNHDISFIATQSKAKAIVYYVTNYATKVEDPLWKRAAAVSEGFDRRQSKTGRATSGGMSHEEEPEGNRTRKFMMRVANRVFTERPLSQVEVVANLLGYPTEFTGVQAWTFLNVSLLYWHIVKQWHHQQLSNGHGDVGVGNVDEAITVEEAGRRLSYVEAYGQRGNLLSPLCLYDYMTLVMVRRRSEKKAVWGEVPFKTGSSFASEWVQVLRRPGMHAVVCLDGFLSLDFDERMDDSCVSRAAVQHLALFVPWEDFLRETTADIDSVWRRCRDSLPGRLQCVVNNAQLLRQSAEDARRDARQWAATSGEGDLSMDVDDNVPMDGRDDGKAAFRSDEIGDAGRLIDLVRSASSAGQITAGSRELADVMQRLSHFQQSALCSQDELRASRLAEGGKRRVGEGLAHLEGVDIPSQAQVRGIKSQQKSASKEVESLVQGTQRRSRKVEECATASWQRQDVVGLVEEVETIQCPTVGPAVNLEWRVSDSFYAEGERISEAFTLNTRQCAALLLICRHLDSIQHVQRETDVEQLCQFIGGEGGTGKSRIIEAIVELFTRRDVGHRLLVTATSGTAAARINGITIHSACNLSVEQRSASAVSKRLDGAQASGPGLRFVSGQSRMHWQDKQLLILDEVSMLGARTLFAINEQLQSLRGSSRDFGGIPIVLFCGDFHQFRPVQERLMLLPSTMTSWDDDASLRIEQRHEHDVAHALWKRFSTVVMLNEQVRAAGDPELQGLLTRIRQGSQTQADLDLLNDRCYEEGKRIPWETGITVVTPLNRNRWNLNMEATVAFQRQRQATLRIFLSEHKWVDGQPTEEEAIMMQSQGDDSGIPVPSVFMFVPGMPIVVNKNTLQGLKLVNGASYTAVDVVLDKVYPGHRISADTILHFGPPAALVLMADSTKTFNFVGMPPGTILLAPLRTRINCERKRPWQQTDCSRKGLPCTAAFACTDYKVQGRTLQRVALELRGTRTTNINGEAVPLACDPCSLYVQLSRCPTLDGIMLLSKVRKRDFIGNTASEIMVAAKNRLEELSETTLMEFKTWQTNFEAEKAALTAHGRGSL
ncbi:helitron helicase-like domain protein [Metarhizium robertsii]|uniref:ATP-dependent DNA helicase n=1 Tax=Metarhizium robertsii TaxID=568076 RepID=A0A014MUN9_9HYPO|nr:helitron helicase-like domain protein [Metarhizium robertsii]